MNGAGWGRSQYERHADALDPGWVRVDERSSAQFLYFAREYAELLRFRDPDGAADHDWRDLFQGDISFLLAEICLFDLRRAELRTNALARGVQWREDGTQRAVAEVYRDLRKIDRWQRRARHIEDHNGDPLAQLLASTIDGMIGRSEAGPDGDLRAWVRAVEAHPDWRRHWERLAGEEDDRAADAAAAPWYRAGPWAAKPATAASGAGGASGAGTTGRAPDTADDLAMILNHIDTTEATLRDFARQLLARSLDAKSDHPAHTTLFIAFVELLGLLQADLNSFTERHLDYFYRTVLRLEPAASRADSVYVTMELAPGARACTLPAGTLLQAGQDAAGADILFATVRTLDVTPARLASIRNLYMECAEGADGRRGVTRVLAAPRADTQDGSSAPLLDPEAGWPTFRRTGHAAFAPAGLDAQVGLLLSSPLLALGSGRRHVRISLVVRAAGFAAMQRAWLRALGRRARVQLPRALRRREYGRLLDRGFRLEASGAAGWLAVPLLHLRPRRLADGQVALDLRFALAPGDPPLAFAAGLEGVPPGPWPWLRLTLDPAARVYPLSAFSRARFERIEVAVDVRGLAGLALRGELGSIAAGQPFHPFGALAPCGARLDVAHAELGKRGVRHVRVRLSWLNVGPGGADLERRYAGYGQAFDAAQFVLRSSVYDGARWIDQGRQPLFAAPAADPACACSIVSFAPRPAGAASTLLGVPVAAALPGPVQPLRGTVRLELAGPAYGFGADLYVPAASDRAMRNAALMLDKRQPLPALLPPLMPQVREIRCDYRASESRPLLHQPAPGDDDGTRLAFLYPFGWCPAGAAHEDCMLVDDGYPGRLYLGLAGAAPGETLVLHFQFAERGSDADYLWQRGETISVRPLRWRYMRANRWHDFAPHQVESSTREFNSSGLVTLHLPAGIDAGNSAMPAGLFWIEIGAAGAALDSMSVGISPHGVRAVRRSALPREGAAPSLAPGSIAGLLKKTPAIRAVTQRYPSIGGEGAESLRAFRARVSERLRHKGRAIVPADYEQLVLAEFPGIRQVKCITANNSRDFVAGLTPPGEVALAVTATAPVAQEDGGPGFKLQPLPQRLLADVAARLVPCLSASVRRLRVRNPRRETLQVFVDVVFTDDAGTDTLRRRLNAGISAHIAPWLRDPEAPLPLGCQVVHGHKVAQFIREEPYVKGINMLALLHTYREGDGYRACRHDETGTVRLSTPWSLFVPAEEHAISVEADIGAGGSDADWAGRSAGARPGIGSVGIKGGFIVGTRSEGGWQPEGGAKAAPSGSPPQQPPASYVIEVAP
jgi:hypothetical protein